MPKPKDPIRQSLPSRRQNETWHARVDGQSLFFTVGFKEDGTPGELFIDVARYGAAIRDWMGQTAQMFSLNLQRQMPLELMVDFFIFSRSEPCGRVEHDDSWGFRITNCTSIMDLIVRTMAVAYLNRKDLATVASVPKWIRPIESTKEDLEFSEPSISFTSTANSITPNTTSAGPERSPSMIESPITGRIEGQDCSPPSTSEESAGRWFAYGQASINLLNDCSKSAAGLAGYVPPATKKP